jgi:hypothetical protein
MWMTEVPVSQYFYKMEKYDIEKNEITPYFCL